MCGYPEWALKDGQQLEKKSELAKKRKDQIKKDKPRGHVVLPYIKGVSERLGRSFNKRDINLYHKAEQTLRQDKMEPTEQCGVVYQSECEVCGECYIGETGRSLGERVEEHDKSVAERM